MPDTEKRVALVTGANKGIGFEIAAKLAGMHITVLLGARNPDRGVKAREQLSRKEPDVHFILLDVADVRSIQAAVGRIKDEFQRLDILVNNAGIMVDSETHITELNATILQNTIETNSLGPLLLSQACLPLMKRNHYGRIVNMSSSLGSLAEIANPDSALAGIQAPAYRLSKTFLNGITALLAAELRGTNILVNSACPGWVRTDLGGPQATLSPQEGADTPVWLATLPDGGPTGGFFRERQPTAW